MTVFSLLDKALAVGCAASAVLLVLTGTEIAHQRATISELKSSITRISTEKTAAVAAGLACTASVESLHQAALTAAARLAAAQARASAALLAATSHPLPPTPAGCTAAATWALTQAPTLSSAWGFPK